MQDDASPDRWRRLEEILASSWSLDPSERDAYLVSRAAGDQLLLDELRELSAAREAADEWTASAGSEQTEPAARRIGPYLLDRLIGRGGMGAVYLAHRADGEFEQQIAVKVIGLPFEIEAFRDRFRRERQILAGLSHPHIAHLLDGGTTDDGELYLAMEYIDGTPIDEYSRELPLVEQLRLFREVCAGIQYSHQNLVVHRDIKPANILVDRAGAAKLLDFGAAKLLAGTGSDEVGTRIRMMTIAYASPEQLRGEAASTLSDVFSLGVLLFRLVTGQEAFGSDLMARASQSKDGAELNLPAKLPGDLDRIARKALAVDPAQRYSSPEQLSEDIRRYQSGEPVLAHPPSAAYKARRFAQRHSWGIAITAAFVVSLISLTFYSVRQARAARQEAERAQSANQFLATVFRIPFSDAASHHDMTVQELLELAEKRVTPALGQDPAVATDIDIVLGSGFQSLEASAHAKALFERALERARRGGDVQREAIAMSQLASVAYQTSDVNQAWAQALQSLSLWKSHRRDFTPQLSVPLLATAGQILEYIRPADPVHREYLEEAVRLERMYPGKIDSAWRSLALQALVEADLSRPRDIARNNRDAYPLIQEALVLDRSDPSLEGMLLATLQSWGRVNRFLGNYAEDEAAQREAYQLMLKHYGPNRGETASQRAIWAISLTGVGKIDESYRESQAALAVMRREYPVPGSFQLWSNTAAAAYPACLTERFKQCEDLAREALQTLGPHPLQSDPRLFEAKSYLGLALNGQRRYSEALPLLKEGLEFYRSRNRTGPFRDVLERGYAQAQRGGG
jgi:eukaryotic-like serine/threonine-protein kinase